MNIELKNIKHYPAMSEETNAFSAILYVDGKPIANCKDSGQGGCIDIWPSSPENRLTLDEVIKYCKSLPPVPVEGYSPLPNDIELFVGNLVADDIRKKQEQKYKKKMEKAIFVCNAMGDPVYFYTLRRTMTDYLSLPNGREQMVKFLYETVIPKLKPSERIMNDNIPTDILELSKSLVAK